MEYLQQCCQMQLNHEKRWDSVCGVARQQQKVASLWLVWRE